MVKESGQQPDTLGGSGNGHGARDSLADTASAAAEQMQSAATEQIEQQKRAASQSIQAFAQAVRRASDELKNQDQTAAAQLIQQAAGGLESLSETLSNRSFGEMVEMARDFGRRNPMALAGGAALLGLALGRVARTATAGNGSHDTHALSDQTSRASSGTLSGSGAAGEFPASRASSPRATSPSTSPSQSRPQSTSTSPSKGPSTPKATNPPRPGSQYGGKTSGGSND
jgi:exonuclease VII large subunit